jgi:hypothetical protein
LVTLFEAEEVGDVVRHLREVYVRHAELAGARFRHPDLRYGSFSLAYRSRSTLTI